MKEIRLGIAGASGRGGRLFEKIGEFFDGVKVSSGVMREFFYSIREQRQPLVGIQQAMDFTLPALISQRSVLDGCRWLPVPDSRDWTIRREN